MTTLPNGYTFQPPHGAEPSIVAPGTGNGWTTYSNPPAQATDAAGRVFRGVLCFKQATGKLHYIVFLPNEGGRVVWESEPDSGSANLDNSFGQPLKVVRNTQQGKNTPTDDAIVPEYTPFALPQGGAANLPSVTLAGDNPIFQLYQGEYKSDQEVLGVPGLFVRLNKLLAGLREVVQVLVRLGLVKRA
jgi:hypothetical protein